MSASVVQICNLSLLKYGDIEITSLTDNSKQARACKVFYPLLRDQLLYSFPWNFAAARSDISAQLSTTPDFEWEYAYTIPVDCLRVLEIYGTDAEWVVEGRELKTDLEEEIYIKYIKQVTLTGYFTPGFVNCLSTLLAAELASKLAGDKQRRLQLLEEFHKVCFPEARLLETLEGNPHIPTSEEPLDEGNFTWQTEGR